MNISKIYGHPGNGKTTNLINRVKEKIGSGYDIKDIGFISFTKTATLEAYTRACNIGFNFDKRDNWFRTIHSACLFLMKRNMLGGDVVTFDDKKRFCTMFGMNISAESDDIAYGDEIPDGNIFFNIESYLANAKMNEYDWKKTQYAGDFDRDYVEIYKAWKEYKEDKYIIDFSDMLKEVIDTGVNIPTKLLFVDEFQDISPLQYDVVNQFMNDKDMIFVCGDPNQAIYRFQAAHPEILLEMKCDVTDVLPKSYRLRKNILNQCSALINLNMNKVPNNSEPRDEGGLVNFLMHPNDQAIMSTINHRNTFILLRTNSLVNRFSWTLAKFGYPFRYIDSKKEESFGWSNDKKRNLYHRLYNNPNFNYEIDRMVNTNQMKPGYATYMRYYIKNYCKPIVPEDIGIQIGTIHSAKGREADTVIVFDDITPKVAYGIKSVQDLEDERRVFYVAMTRAREHLVIVHNYFKDNISFELPSMLGVENNNPNNPFNCFNNV